MEANEAADAGGHRAPRAPGATPRRRSRAPLRTVAPTITGRATVRESRFACSRSKPRQRAAARVAPFRDTPGTSAAAWPSAERQAVDGRRPRRGRGAAAGGRRRASRPRPRAARRRSPAGRRGARSIWRSKRVADDRRRDERERDDRGAAGVERAAARRRSRAAARSAAPPRPRRAARPRSSCATPGRGRSQRQPASQGSERQVRRARHRQQLRRPLDERRAQPPCAGVQPVGRRQRQARRASAPTWRSAPAPADEQVDDRRSRSPRPPRSRGSGGSPSSPPSGRRPPGR